MDVVRTCKVFKLVSASGIGILVRRTQHAQMTQVCYVEVLLYFSLEFLFRRDSLEGYIRENKINF